MPDSKLKLIRTATVPKSLFLLLKGQLHFLSNYYQVIGVSGDDDMLYKTAKRENIQVYPIDFERRINIYKDVLALIRLYQFLRKEKPQIIHSITPKAGLISMLAAKFAGVPVRIHTFTGLFFPTQKGLMKQLLIAMDKLLCWAATDIIPEGKGVRNDLINFKITNKPLTIIGHGNVNGTNLSHYDSTLIPEHQKSNLRKKLRIPEDAFVFVFVGRLVKDKGINELVEAFVALTEQQLHKKTVLLLVGDEEPELDPLSLEIIASIHNMPEIVAVGHQDDVRPYMAISQALVLPSYREGFPNVVLEAGAMGLPCIVTDINGSNEIIVNGKNGLIVPAKSISELQQAMLKLSAGEKECYHQLQSNSRPMIESRFQNETIWQALLSFYDKATQRQH